MRTLLSLVVVLAVLIDSRVSDLLAAPVPTEKPQSSIDGKYTLLSVSSPADRGNGAAGGPIGPGGGVLRRTTQSTYMVGPATITKNEIALEGRAVTPATAAALGIPPGGTTMEYSFDATKMTIDVLTTNLRGKKSTAPGRVEVVGNRLIIAVAKEGDERPKTTEEEGDVTVYYFQKEPAPKTEVRIVALTVGKEEAVEKELNKLMQAGFELVSTTAIAPTDSKSAATTVHFVLKRTTKQP